MPDALQIRCIANPMQQALLTSLSYTARRTWAQQSRSIGILQSNIRLWVLNHEVRFSVGSTWWAKLFSSIPTVILWRAFLVQAKQPALLCSHWKQVLWLCNHTHLYLWMVSATNRIWHLRCKKTDNKLKNDTLQSCKRGCTRIAVRVRCRPRNYPKPHLRQTVNITKPM